MAVRPVADAVRAVSRTHGVRLGGFLVRPEQNVWDVGCLYNQETGEDPQLYFSHMVKTGDPLTLAWEIRAGMDRTAAVRA